MRWSELARRTGAAALTPAAAAAGERQVDPEALTRTAPTP